MRTASERFKAAIEPFRLEMDQEARDIFDGLIKNIQITSITPPPKEMYRDKDVITISDFKGKHASVMLAHFIKPEEDFINQQIDGCRYMQFLTHQENVLYSRGTKNILRFLTEHHFKRTEKAAIMAFPSSRVSGGPAGGKSQSFINESHLTGTEALYGDERSATIAFVTDNRFIAVHFEEKVQPKHKR
jgi:hypothetical protein